MYKYSLPLVPNFWSLGSLYTKYQSTTSPSSFTQFTLPLSYSLKFEPMEFSILEIFEISILLPI
ncbi:hypothetical protein PPV_Vac110-(032-033)n1 [Avipoxvirus sp.]|nr:ALPV-056 [Albatrosspox virus]WPD91054.1 hypothetical protein PPV_Vac110-(032-033)n1 [Avipoxvirus sp.]